MRWQWAAPLGALAALSTASGGVHAVQYYTVEAAQRALFPAAAEFVSREALLTDEQRRAVSTRSDTRLARDARVRAWTAIDADGKSLGTFMLDEVTGKHELIGYALAVSPDGRALGVEILDYRETYGGQIRDVRWRAQFNGKTTRDPLQLDRDIANISGATLSCSHVTDGIRRLLALYELVLKPNV